MRKLMCPEELRLYVNTLAEKHISASVETITRRVLAACLSKIFKDDNNRHLFLLWLTGCPSTKTVPACYVVAVLKWLECNDFFSVPPEHVRQEALQALEAAAKEANLGEPPNAAVDVGKCDNCLRTGVPVASFTDGGKDCVIVSVCKNCLMKAVIVLSGETPPML